MSRSPSPSGSPHLHLPSQASASPVILLDRRASRPSPSVFIDTLTKTSGLTAEQYDDLHTHVWIAGDDVASGELLSRLMNQACQSCIEKFLLCLLNKDDTSTQILSDVRSLLKSEASLTPKHKSMSSPLQRMLLSAPHFDLTPPRRTMYDDAFTMGEEAMVSNRSLVTLAESTSLTPTLKRRVAASATSSERRC